MVNFPIDEDTPVAISYVENLQFDQHRKYVQKKDANYTELAFCIGVKKILYISFNLDSVITRIELGDGVRDNRILLLLRSYVGIFLINEVNFSNMVYPKLNFYLDYYNEHMKRNDMFVKDILDEIGRIISAVLQMISKEKTLYQIEYRGSKYVWKEQDNKNDVQFLYNCLQVNRWETLKRYNDIEQIYDSNITVLPPDIRPDLNPEYCVIQTSTGCKVKDIRGKACGFCRSFNGVAYKEYSVDKLIKEIQGLKEHYPQSLLKSDTCFVADGDAISADNFIDLVDLIKKMLPNIIHFESFISTYSILNMPKERWNQLKEIGLSCVYWGVESADDETLRFLGKPQNEWTIHKARSILEENNIPYAIIVMCGMTGIHGESINLSNHIPKTCKFINDSECRKVYISKLSIVEGSKLYEEMKKGYFIPMTWDEAEQEYRIMIGKINKHVNGSYGNQFIM